MKDFVDEEGNSLVNEERKFKLRKRKFRATCPHCSKKGKTLLSRTGTENVFQCSRKGCGTTVDLRKYVRVDSSGIEELKGHADELRNALEICKHRAALDGDNKESQVIVSRCAALIMDLSAVPDLMESLLETTKSKNKKKEHHRQTIEMGLGSLAFNKKKKERGGW